jgi:SAM-dependent methyltransferase
MVSNENQYTNMQKSAYAGGTSNHEEHNTNPDYWDILLSDLKYRENWSGKNGLDFACGKGRNVTNMLSLCDWNRVDGIDISSANIEFCKATYSNQNSKWYCNSGTNVSDLRDNEYDFIMSTIALQHIPVYDIRKSLITDLLRTLKPGGLFSFQMGYGDGLESSIGPRVSYFENYYNAPGTNSICDVRVQSEDEIISDLMQIGFVNITTEIKNSYSDDGHTHWIYVKAYKPKI